MSPSRKTWIWIIVSVLAVCFVALIAVAGAGIYFVSHHIEAKRTTSADALRSFETNRARFKDTAPLFEIDSTTERARATRRITDLPTSTTRPESLVILAWNPDDERVVKVSLPFWLLRMGRKKIDLFNGDRGFDLERLSLDVNELERIGPALVLDLRARAGERVLVWTQ